MSGAPVVFLDVDGVICTPLSFKLNALLHTPSENMRFDPVAMFYLRLLVKCSGARIILTSSWRDGFECTDEYSTKATRNLLSRLAANGTPIAGLTPILPYSNGGRGAEIELWLDQNFSEGQPQYVILDDTPYFEEYPQLRAHWVSINSAYGFRRQELIKAKALLCVQKIVRGP